MLKRIVRPAIGLVVAVALVGCGKAEPIGTNEPDPPFFQAIADGDLNRVKQYLAESPDALNRIDGPMKMTPLHKAAEADQVDVARFLIEQGAHVNTFDVFGRTPLVAAQDFDASSAMIGLLESHGATD